ncbi:hypothetical protein HYH02_003536 [Chlamydomonas schloesseri]|uniref:Uncharacterized protein n=1 Tax=Chlamydomonas schloesseri TaxID=2026947 RepID=A0A835WQR6_9CHLO|nr:hypothetical protein HYH02_003536 [Chlamydomonas schloesseri]|eukprot:KAG2451757.1 hypothetical protein HYH02_003536 [Chlamydomonas schloesseri]
MVKGAEGGTAAAAVQLYLAAASAASAPAAALCATATRNVPPGVSTGANTNCCSRGCNVEAAATDAPGPAPPMARHPCV